MVIVCKVTLLGDNGGRSKEMTDGGWLAELCSKGHQRLQHQEMGLHRASLLLCQSPSEGKGALAGLPVSVAVLGECGPESCVRGANRSAV